MSTGHGHLQRQLLALIDANDGLLDTFELVERVFGIAPDPSGRILLSEAQVVSVRRALRKLASEAHIVAVGRDWHNRRARWASKRAHAAYESRKAKLLSCIA
jgi:hypothetical protein